MSKGLIIGIVSVMIAAVITGAYFAFKPKSTISSGNTGGGGSAGNGTGGGESTTTKPETPTTTTVTPSAAAQAVADKAGRGFTGNSFE